MISNKAYNAGNITLPILPELKDGDTMAFDEKIDLLNLSYIARNSADNVIELSNSTMPGRYTLMPVATISSNLSNYDVAYIAGTYTITSKSYTVETAANKFNNSIAGKISLTNEGTEFAASEELLFVAEPYSGYEVDKWEVTTANQEQPIATQNGGTKLNYTMKAEAIKVTVFFKNKTIKLNIHSGVGGSVELPKGFETGASAKPKSEFVFVAAPKVGYHFTKWTQMIGQATTNIEGKLDEKTGKNTLSFTMPSSTTDITANFERDSYTVNLGEHLIATYMHDDDGLSTTPTIEKVVNSGDKVQGDTELTVKAAPGYIVNVESSWKKNDVKVNGEDGNKIYKFSVIEDSTISVGTTRGTYDITTSTENGYIDTMLDGIKSEALTGIAGGTAVTFKANAYYGYEFSGWKVNDKSVVEPSTTLVLGPLGDNTKVTAEFIKLDLYQVTPKFNSNYGTITYTLKSNLGKIIKENEAVSADMPVEVFKGDSITFNVSPKLNFMVEKWIVNGIVDDNSKKQYEINSISASQEIVAQIVPQLSYTVIFDSAKVTVTSDGNPVNSGDEVGGGTKVIFTPKALGANKMIKSWNLNNNVVNNIYGNPLVDDVYVIEGLSGKITSL